MNKLARYVVIVLWLAGVATLMAYGFTSRVLPRCPEDAVLVGAGQFKNGRWDFYECGPAVDDMIGD